MKKVLLTYFSLTGNTEQMAQYIAEGLRIAGVAVVVQKIADLKKSEDLDGYDGYLFGSPTYHRDIVEPMKTFLFMSRKANLSDKLAGAFGTYTHSGDAPGIIFDTMEHVYKMRPFELSSFRLTDDKLATREGIKACQDYGRVFGEALKK